LFPLICRNSLSFGHEDEVCRAVMFIKSNAAWVDEIPLSLITSACWVHWLTSSIKSVLVRNFRLSVAASLLLPILKVAYPLKFSDYRPISFLAYLSKVFQVLIAQQMESHIRRNGLLTVSVRYYSGDYIKDHEGHSIEYGGWLGNGIGLIWLFMNCYWYIIHSWMVWPSLW
jgi:hypothetical protein